MPLENLWAGRACGPSSSDRKKTNIFEAFVHCNSIRMNLVLQVLMLLLLSSISDRLVFPTRLFLKSFPREGNMNTSRFVIPLTCSQPSLFAHPQAPSWVARDKVRHKHRVCRCPGNSFYSNSNYIKAS